MMIWQSGMNIEALTVCVNFSQYFKYCLGNKRFFKRWIVVTTRDDTETINLCKEHGLEICISDRFYEEGASFKKGAAINDGFKMLNKKDWIAIIDADIILPDNFQKFLAKRPLNTDNFPLHDPGHHRLFSINRVTVKDPTDQKIARMFNTIQETGLQGKQGHLGYGYFQLFNSKFLVNKGITEFNKLYPEISTHAGYDDHVFSNYFPEKRSLDLTAIHLGESEKHWWGYLRKIIP